MPSEGLDVARLCCSSLAGFVRRVGQVLAAPGGPPACRFESVPIGVNAHRALIICVAALVS